MKRVLLIEPEFFARVVLDDQLAERGFQVSTVKRIRDALIRLRTQVFHVVMMSYEDDFNTAIRLLATLRQNNNKIPVVFLTKQPTQEQLLMLMEARPVELVVKPYSLNSLVERLHNACNSSQGVA